MSNNNLEIERKYLIKMPDMEKLRKAENYDWSEIEQVYVNDTMDGMFGRIRKRGKNGVYKYYKTFKKDVTAVTRVEIESEISEKEYTDLKKHCREGFGVIEKTRHVFDYKGLTFELDIFPFWNDKAFLEAEVASEDTEIPIPDFIEVIKEVTEDISYRNSALAVWVFENTDH